ncbi:MULTISPECIES: MmoB/DmpM family protein [Martelella]|uniref:Monooxygenase n=2 Tax=Martelella TaxID=293088 RepID=A0A5C4JNI5_9HYPH|nr:MULTISPECIES: MmoB/DmpM family protein [Martelella]MBB4120346.1 phenol hydroxylase P2 protein [Martelella radicis]TNB46840.1 monooxygenase [Martelella lutilitoris]
MAQLVSITLQDTNDGRMIADAIRQDNPGVETLSMPGALKLDRAGDLIIRASTVSEKIGREWDPQEIHLTMISMAGNLDEDDDYFALSWNR